MLWLAFRKKPAPSLWTEDDLRRCLAAIDSGMGVNASSRLFGIPKPTIRRHRLGLNKYATEDKKLRGGPCVLPPDVEDELVSHIKNLDELFFGVTATDLRTLAYQVARSHGINKFSETKQKANKTWYYGFMRRHPDLSLRRPEPTSIGRMKGFNRKDVGEYFDKYYQVLDENGFTADKIYNVDETGHSTVQVPSKVISTKGKRQVGAATSAERGTNTTGVYCNSATGHFIPPMLIFKRKRMADSLKNGAPDGTVFACTDSGWINADVFVQWLRHFIACVKPSPDNKYLLLLDGHTCHSKNLEAIQLARDNGIIMLSFPGHTTHRLQPLDVAFFKSLKSSYNIEIENHLRATQGSPVGAHQVSRLVGRSFVKAATMETALNGFRKTGLWPPNRNIFDGEFSRMEALIGDACPDCEMQTSPGEPECGRVNPASRGRPPHETPSATAPTNHCPDASSPIPVSPTVSCDVPNLTPPANNCLVTSSVTPMSVPTVSCDVPNFTPPAAPPLSATDSCSSGLRSVPTQGDGRCFFRAIAIALNPDLQTCERHPLTGEILDEVKRLHETARADNLRTMTISHMCENLHLEPSAAELNADMPQRLRFQTVAERILHMSNPKSMVGELEIQATAAALKRAVHVIIDGTGHVSKYNETAQCDERPVAVKFIPNGDSGHYEGTVLSTIPMPTTVPPRICFISPLPRRVAATKRRPMSSKSNILTSSPYKVALETRKNAETRPRGKADRAKSQKAAAATSSYTAARKKTKPGRDGGEDDADPDCIVCGERFSLSRSREKWIACVFCNQWAHEECTPGDPYTYMCHHCEDYNN